MAGFQKDGNRSPGEGKKSTDPVTVLKALNNIKIPNWVPIAFVLTVIAVMATLFLLDRYGRGARGDGGQQSTAFAEQQDPNAFEVEVLPKTVRSFGGEAVNPFAGPGGLGEMKVTGIIINSNGKATAIIEAGDASYIISLGETLPESEWTVSRIEKNSVTFTLNGSDKTIYIES